MPMEIYRFETADGEPIDVDDGLVRPVLGTRIVSWSEYSAMSGEQMQVRAIVQVVGDPEGTGEPLPPPPEPTTPQEPS